MSHSAVNPRLSQAVMRHPGRPTRDDAFEVAYRQFVEGQRLDMCKLADELGIGRSTLYRWWTSREVLIGEVVWRITSDVLDRLEARTRARGRDRLVRIFGRLAENVRNFAPLAKFVADDPDYALRVLTSSYSVVQEQLVAWWSTRLAAIPEIDPAVDIDDLAYAIVRIGEAFIWSDMITGSPPRPEKATAIVELLLAGACESRSGREGQQ